MNVNNISQLTFPNPSIIQAQLPSLEDIRDIHDGNGFVLTQPMSDQMEKSNDVREYVSHPAVPQIMLNIASSAESASTTSVPGTVGPESENRTQNPFPSSESDAHSCTNLSGGTEDAALAENVDSVANKDKVNQVSNAIETV